MHLRDTLNDANHFLRFYGTTPPRSGTPDDRIERAASRFAARTAPLDLDGVVVYDVQDEDSRTAAPRPFPYLPTIDSRQYAQLLGTMISPPLITYKSIGTMTAARWEPWLTETRTRYGLDYLSLVGLPSSQGQHSALPLPQATRLAAAHPGRFTLGGVVIAERHTPERSESDRIRRKVAAGCRYFISQAVYSAAPTIQLLHEYARACAEHAETPRRIILTFVPIGREKTLEFIRWLGVAIDNQTASQLLHDANPLQRSIAICRDHLRAILEQPYTQTIPLGLNVESISIYKDEIEGSIELAELLREVARSYGLG